jgi:hypothetical protein
MANWIAGATKNKGALHRALGVPQGKKIPQAKVTAAAARGGRVGKEARLAETLSHLRPHAAGGPVSKGVPVAAVKRIDSIADRALGEPEPAKRARRTPAMAALSKVRALRG